MAPGHRKRPSGMLDDRRYASGQSACPETASQHCNPNALPTSEPESTPGVSTASIRREEHPIAGAAWRFLQLGGLAFGLNLAITVTAHGVLGLPANVAFAIALVILFFVNFFGFRRFVYRACGPAHRQMLRFLSALIPLRALELVAFLVLHNWVGIGYLLAAALILAASAIAKFLIFRQWVFAD